MRIPIRAARLAIVSTAALTALAISAGCASTASSDDANAMMSTSTLREGLWQNPDAGEPVPTPTLRFGTYSEPRSLDPAVTIAAGSTGGTEMLNLYDSLTRYDTDSKTFVPQLAESLTANESADTWTLTLRPGVTFSDGKPLDAAAVANSQERYVRLKGPEAALWNVHVDSIEVVDPLTVRYHLGQAWPGFANILSTGPGMIVGPDSLQGSDFAPVGVGPFTLEKWSTREIMILKARDGYWGGTPNTAELRFSYPNDQQVNLDSLRIGQLDTALFLAPDMAEQALAIDGGRYVNITAANNVALINASEGRPGSDVRVRRAMQLATDPDVMMSRPFGESGSGSSDLFPDFTRWHSTQKGLQYDPEQARALLSEAKADGYNGQITYLHTAEESARAIALAIQAQLGAVGFDVTLQQMSTIGDVMAKVVVDRDYDLSTWGLSYREADPYPKMFATLHSSGNQVYGTLTSPEMDALLVQLRDPANTEATRSTIGEIQSVLNEQVPFLNWGAYAEVNAWSPQVHDVVGASNSMLLFSDAWAEK